MSKFCRHLRQANVSKYIKIFWTPSKGYHSITKNFRRLRRAKIIHPKCFRARGELYSNMKMCIQWFIWNTSKGILKLSGPSTTTGPWWNYLKLFWIKNFYRGFPKIRVPGRDEFSTRWVITLRRGSDEWSDNFHILPILQDEKPWKWK